MRIKQVTNFHEAHRSWMDLNKNRSAPVGKAIQDLSQFKMPVFVGDFRRLENSKA